MSIEHIRGGKSFGTGDRLSKDQKKWDPVPGENSLSPDSPDSFGAREGKAFSRVAEGLAGIDITPSMKAGELLDILAEKGIVHAEARSDADKANFNPNETIGDYLNQRGIELSRFSQNEKSIVVAAAIALIVPTLALIGLEKLLRKK